MNDIVALGDMYVGGEPCSEDPEVMKKARDVLLAPSPTGFPWDYGATEAGVERRLGGSVQLERIRMRVRLNTNGDVLYGYPKEGYPLFMDSVALLKDATNVEEA